MSSPLTGWPAVLVAVPAGLLGAAVAVMALLTHRDAVRVADVLVPWGLALATLGSVLPSLALRSLGAGGAGGRRLRRRYGAWSCSCCSSGRGEGDYLVAGDARGWGFLVVASLAVVAVTLGGLGGRATRPGRHG